jgi:hypothetical protein
MSITSRIFCLFFVYFVVTSSASAHTAHETYHGHEVEYAAAAEGYTVDHEDLSVDGKSVDILYTDPAPQQWQDMLPYAQQVWGGKTPDCEVIRMATFSTDVLSVGAKAEVGGCNIWVNIAILNSNYSAHARCILIAHEYGHLLGMQHTPGGLMSGSADMYNVPTPVCDELGRKGEVVSTAQVPVKKEPPARTLAKLTFKRATRIINGWYNGKWSIKSCKRKARYVVECDGYRPGRAGHTRHHLFTVTISADGYASSIN